MKASRPHTVAPALHRDELGKARPQSRIRPARPIPRIAPPDSRRPGFRPGRSGRRDSRGLCAGASGFWSAPIRAPTAMRSAACWPWACCSSRWASAPTWSPPTGFRSSIAVCRSARLSATAMRVHGPYDAVILLECDGLERARLRGLEKFFLINIDHHVSGRDFGH